MLVELYQKHRAAFDRYQSLLLKWNEKINLTAITTPEEIVEKHFLDSLALIPALALWRPSENVSRETFLEGQTLLDIGAGGGFPGLPLKIVLPSLKVTLVDSVKKKCDFMKEVVRALGLSGVDILHQMLSPHQSLGGFDFIVTRAAFSLSDFLNLGVASLKPTGMMVAYKMIGIEREIEGAKEVCEELHLNPFESYPYKLPMTGVSHQLLMTHFHSKS